MRVCCYNRCEGARIWNAWTAVLMVFMVDRLAYRFGQRRIEVDGG